MPKAQPIFIVTCYCNMLSKVLRTKFCEFENEATLEVILANALGSIKFSPLDRGHSAKEQSPLVLETGVRRTCCFQLCGPLLIKIDQFHAGNWRAPHQSYEHPTLPLQRSVSQIAWGHLEGWQSDRRQVEEIERHLHRVDELEGVPSQHSEQAMSAFCQGRANPVFSKPCLCLSNTRHLRCFRGYEEQSPCFQWGRMQIRHFRRFGQNDPFLAFWDKNTVCAKNTVCTTPILETRYIRAESWCETPVSRPLLRSRRQIGSQTLIASLSRFQRSDMNTCHKHISGSNGSNAWIDRNFLTLLSHDCHSDCRKFRIFWCVLVL